MKIKLSYSADTEEGAGRIEKREESVKKHAILDNMKEMLGKLRDQFQQAATDAKEAIRKKMEMIKKRFNELYKQLHDGEEYYSLASDGQHVRTIIKRKSHSGEFNFETVCPGPWKKYDKMGVNQVYFMSAQFNDETQQKFAKMVEQIRKAGCKIKVKEGMYMKFVTPDHAECTLYYDGLKDGITAVDH